MVLDRRGPIRLARLPWHPWSPGGTLLVDRAVPLDGLADTLVDGLRGAGASLAWFDDVPAENPEWQAVMRAFDRRAYRHRLERRWGVGQVIVVDSWEHYESHLPKNLRRNMKKAFSKLERQGEVEYVALTEFPETSWREPWNAFLDIEHGGWKGAEGTSIRHDASMLRFFDELAERFHAAGRLELLQLRHQGETISAEFGYSAKGTYFSHKVGYDERFADMSPGNLLMYLQLQEYHRTGVRSKLDAISPIGPTMERWANRLDMRYRLIASLSRAIGNGLAGAVELAITGVRHLKRPPTLVIPDLPAAGSLA